jgi:hypothetical protein
MKKLTLMFVLLLLGSLGAMAQIDALVSVGGEILRGKDKMRGDNEIFEARLMIGQPELRFGPFVNGTWSYSFTNSKLYSTGYYYRSRDLTFGLAIDSKKKGDNLYRYLWLNTGLRFSRDRGWDNVYEANQTDKIFCLSGGLSFHSLYQNWFGSNSVFFEAQEPIGKGSRDVSYTDTSYGSDPFNKERLRIVGEAGIKQIAFFMGSRYLAVDPIIHLGYGWETGSRKQLFEVGAGFGVGYIDSEDYYNECVKLKVYNRQDLNYERGRETAWPSAWIIELTVSVKVALKK